MSYRIAMIGAGSVGFSVAIARELVASKLLNDATFVLMDIDAKSLADTEHRIRALAEKAGCALQVETTLDRAEALRGANFIVTSFAPHRVDFWIRDIEIARRHGIDLLQGENGGPCGQIHALRNITILIDIVRDMEALCPGAWLMNFTNPMSMLCTYLYKHTSVKALGFCHQVHGSFGVIAEMLGMEPGELQVVSAGINHMNFLLDVRKRGSGESCMEDFLRKAPQSTYWQKIHEHVPEQCFTRDFLETFGIYPVGYDNHVCEYMPFFYTPQERAELGYRACVDNLRQFQEKRFERSATGTIDDVEIERILGKGLFPFPKDPAHPYYKETPVSVMEALLTNEPLYLDAMVVTNDGAVANLPDDAALDVPVVITGGEARSVRVGELPFFAAELCRRQIATHELVAQAAVTGNRQRFLEALCLDPSAPSLSTARALMDEYLAAYREYLPQFD